MMLSDCIFFTEHLTLFFSCFSFITAIQYPKLAIQRDGLICHTPIMNHKRQDTKAWSV